VKKKPDPVHMTRVQDEVNDRKAGLHVATRTLQVTRLGIVLTALSLATALVTEYLTIHDSSRPGTTVDPGALVIIKPEIGAGGQGVVAVPTLAAGANPVDYLRGGTQLYIDCFKEIDDEYAFAHISGPYERNNWIDATSLVMPDGTPVVDALKMIGTCKG
jgi:hypothetical protein